MYFYVYVRYLNVFFLIPAKPFPFHGSLCIRLTCLTSAKSDNTFVRNFLSGLKFRHDNESYTLNVACLRENAKSV